MSSLKTSNPNNKDTMRAVVWEGKVREVAVRTLPKPKVIDPDDAVIRLSGSSVSSVPPGTQTTALMSIAPLPRPTGRPRARRGAGGRRR